MSDLISRQAAIDVVENYPHGDWNMQTMKEMVSEIDSLPSAQSGIIRCKDCKYGSPNSKYGCKCYHYTLYETHEMKPEDFCSRAERREE